MDSKERLYYVRQSVEQYGFIVKHVKITSRNKWVYVIYQKGQNAPFVTLDSIGALELYSFGLAFGYCLGKQDSHKER